MPEKRTKPRFGPLVLKAHVTVGNDESPRVGYLTNVSTGGAFLAIDEPPPIGTELSLTAPLPWSLGELCGRARVVWRSEAGASAPKSPGVLGVGLAFTRLEEGVEDMLEAYLQKFAALAAKLDDESTATHDGH